MAIASSCSAVMAAASASARLPRHLPSSQVVRCSAETPSTSSAASNSSSVVKFQRKAEAEPLLASSGSREAQAGRPGVLDPALRFANLMWFRGTFNAQIFVSEEEPADSVVRRFRKAVMQAGVIPECRRRRFFETPQDIRKRKVQAAQRRNKSRRYTPRPDNYGGEKKQQGQTAKLEEDEDFWGGGDAP